MEEVEGCGLFIKKKTSNRCWKRLREKPKGHLAILRFFWRGMWARQSILKCRFLEIEKEISFIFMKEIVLSNEGIKKW